MRPHTVHHVVTLHPIPSDQHHGGRHAAHPSLRSEGLPDPPAHAARVSACEVVNAVRKYAIDDTRFESLVRCVQCVGGLRATRGLRVHMESVQIA